MSECCLIIGAGIAGLTVAIALSRHGVRCEVYEIRDAPATIGGSINLTPNALRLLNTLGVNAPGCTVESFDVLSLRTGGFLGAIPFGPSVGSARRVVRNNLHGALLDAAQKAGVLVRFGSGLKSITDEGLGEIVATFSDGSVAAGNFLIGGDGIHSAVRSSYIEPSRLPVHSGLVAAYGYAPVSKVTSDIPFKACALTQGQKGACVASYVDEVKDILYFGAIMSSKEEVSREGWKARGADREQVLEELNRRYGDSALRFVPEVINCADDIYLYPVYELPMKGRWIRERALLLGDAAHAMPPQGESTGVAIEDALLFAKVYASCPDLSITQKFKVYENTRRPATDEIYKETLKRMENVRDKSWLGTVIMEWAMWAFLWWYGDAFSSKFKHDVLSDKIERST